jgi:ATP synthase F1 delta subunit
MQGVDDILAKKYAQAMINIHGQDWSLKQAQAFAQAAQFLKERRRTLFFLRLSSIEKDIKKEGLLMVCKQYALPKDTETLIDLLLAHKRSFLVHRVFDWLYQLYLRKHNILSCLFKSSHELSKTSVATAQQFLKKLTGCDIITTEIVDPSLIAGLRLQSNTILWEYSVAQHLKRARQLLI